MDIGTCWFAHHVLLKVYLAGVWRSSATLRVGITCF